MVIDEQIKAEQTKLRTVRNPMDVSPASIDVDQELFVLSYNLKVLTNLIFITGNESTRLKKVYNRKMFDLAESIDEAFLKEMTLAKNDKFKYIKLSCTDELAEHETMKNKYSYFCNMRETYTEWVNVYKKTREVPSG